MANQIDINYGAVANDGTGDPIRTAFQKTDENFSNVWAAGPVGSNVNIGNNTVSVVNTNGNLILKPNGIGIIQANSAVIPDQTNTRDLGSNTRTWRTLYVGTGGIVNAGTLTTANLSVGTLSVTGDAVIQGNLTVEGDTIQIGNITTDTLTIQLANAATNAAAANGAGITVGLNDNLATLLFNSNTNTWTTNLGVSVNGAITGTSVAVSDATVYGNVNAVIGNFTGNVSANYFVGNGSQLTGLPATYGNANVANYLPTFSGNISAGNISATGNISGNYFIGNGSQLTGINASSNKIFNGNSYANIATANGNLDINVGNDGYGIWTFVAGTGNLVGPGNASQGAGIVFSADQSVYVREDMGQLNIDAGSDIVITTNSGNVGNTESWTFDSNGNLTVPGNILGSGNILIAPDSASASSYLDIYLTGGPDIHIASNDNSIVIGRDTGANVFVGNDGEVSIRTDNGATPQVWLFDDAGNLTLPGNTFAVNYANGDPVSIGGGGNTGNVTFNDVNIIGTSNLKLQPDSANADAYLDIYLTSGPDIHIAGNGETVILGTDDFANVTVGVDGNVRVQASTGTPYTWTFDTAGNLNLPGNIVGAATIDIDNRASGNSADIQLFAADDITIQARDRTLGSTSEGGDINIYAGDSAEDGDSSGGDVNIRAGDGGAGNVDFGGSGGTITIQSGQGGAAIGNSGYSAESGGALTLNAGDAGSNNGNIDLGADGGNVYIGAGDSTGNGVNGGTIYLTSGAADASALAGDVVIQAGGTWTFDGDGRLTFPGTPRIDTDANNFEVQAAENINLEANVVVNIYTDTSGNAYQWQFGDDGLLTLPNSAVIKDTAGNAVAFGRDAGQSSQGNGAVAIGESAGLTSQGQYAVAIGAFAGNNAQGTDAVAVGLGAGNDTQGITAVAVGREAGYVTQGNAAVAVGEGAGAFNQGVQAVAVGQGAGASNQSLYAVAIGSTAGFSDQGESSVSIGDNAGNTAQGNAAVAIGFYAGANAQSTNAVAIGSYAGETTQGVYSVAIGSSAGAANQGVNSVAIGTQAGQTTQGQFAVAIGDNAGNSGQGTDAVAIGASAGLNTQGAGAVAFGQGTGETSQGANAVALGKAAGQVNQGINSIAIGQSAGLTNQGNNTIILNATGSALDQTTANTFTVAPVRNDVANVGEVVFYNTTSKEITYGNTVSISGNISGNYILGNGSQITNLPAPTVTQDITSNGAMSIMTYDGNIKYVSYATVEPSSGNITGGNVSTTGNVTGNFFIGDGSQLTGISANTGNVTFSGEAVIGTGTSNTQSGLYLAPDPVSLTNDLYLRVRGNILDEPTHIHFDTGNNAYYNQFIGDDNKYIQLANTGNIVINASDYAGNTAQWNFGTDGLLTLPDNLVIAGNTSVFGIDAALIAPAPGLPLIALSAGANGALASLWVEDIGNVGTSNIAAVYANPVPGSGNVRIAVGQNGSPGPNLWDFDTTGNLTAPGNISATGNVTGNYILGNGSQLTSINAVTVDITDTNGLTTVYYPTFVENRTTAQIARADVDLTYRTDDNLLTVGNVSVTGNVTGGNLITTGSGGNITLTGGNITGANVVTANSFVGNGATLSNVATQVTGSWTVTAGTNNYSFTVPINNTYQLWVLGNIPNGIIVYNATVSVSNTNVPVVGQQFAWNYEGGGNILMFTSIPAQIVGTAGSISNAAPAVANTNVFTFGINNTSGNTVTVNYGYTKIS